MDFFAFTILFSLYVTETKYIFFSKGTCMLTKEQCQSLNANFSKLVFRVPFNLSTQISQKRLDRISPDLALHSSHYLLQPVRGFFFLYLHKLKSYKIFSFEILVFTAPK